MKRRFPLALMLLCSTAMAGLDPETLSLTYNRADADTYVNTNTYLSGTSLLLTNCYALVSTGTTQDLTGVFIVLRVGNEHTNFVYSGSVASAASGSFWGLVAIPSHAQLSVPVQIDTTVRVQCTLTNSTGTAFTYRGSKLLTVRSGLAY